MAIVNSFSRGNSGQVTLLVDRVRSSKVRHGAFVVLLAKPWESFSRIHAFGSLNSSTTVAIRINTTGGFVQRSGTNVGDINGKAFDAAGGNTLVIVDAAYSLTGESGPWTAMSVLTTDPQYNWPGTGSVSGTAFKIPVEVLQGINANIWIRLRVSY